MISTEEMIWITINERDDISQIYNHMRDNYEIIPNVKEPGQWQNYWIKIGNNDDESVDK